MFIIRPVAVIKDHAHRQDKGLTMQHDITTRDSSGRKLASYGPRRISDAGLTEPCEPHEATFWRVYRHDGEGHPECVGDAPNSTDAARFARYVAQVETIKILLNA